MKTGVQIPAPLVSHTPISLARGGGRDRRGSGDKLGAFTSVTENMASRRNSVPKEYDIRLTEEDA